LLGNGSVKIPLSLLDNGSVKIPLSLLVARQRLGRNVTAVTNTQATIEELLDAFVFYVARVASMKVGDSFFPELFV
jgi:hypothetical protein